MYEVALRSAPGELKPDTRAAVIRTGNYLMAMGLRELPQVWAEVDPKAKEELRRELERALLFVQVERMRELDYRHCGCIVACNSFPICPGGEMPAPAGTEHTASESSEACGREVGATEQVAGAAPDAPRAVLRFADAVRERGDSWLQADGFFENLNAGTWLAMREQGGEGRDALQMRLAELNAGKRVDGQRLFQVERAIYRCGCERLCDAHPDCPGNVYQRDFPYQRGERVRGVAT